MGAPSITPFKAPAFVSLSDVDKCPNIWGVCTLVEPYDKGNCVMGGTMVYMYKAWPLSTQYR